MAECTHLDQITVARPESFEGCEDCLAIGGRWVHLRVCRSCGKVGCCAFLPQPSRHQARPRHGPSDRQLASSRGRTGPIATSTMSPSFSRRPEP